MVNINKVNSKSKACASNAKKGTKKCKKTDTQSIDLNEYDKLFIDAVRGFPCIWDFRINVKLRSSTNITEAYQKILEELHRKYIFNSVPSREK